MMMGWRMMIFGGWIEVTLLGRWMPAACVRCTYLQIQYLGFVAQELLSIGDDFFGESIEVFDRSLSQ